MKYSLDFSEPVQNISKKYVESYISNHNIRSSHNENMKSLDHMGKEIPVFKEIADCIETLLWMDEQPEEL